MAGRERGRERAGRGEAGTRCDWFAKVVPIGTAVTLSLQGFAGNKALDHPQIKTPWLSLLTRIPWGYFS